VKNPTTVPHLSPVSATIKVIDPMAIAPIYPGGGPTNSILTLVLTDAIGPNHADRVPERRTWQVPGYMEPNLNKR